MKVFAPGQVARVSSVTREDGRQVAYGIPLTGEWLDVESYFKQVTSHRNINDVIHAKVVASTGIPYSDHCGDLVDSGGMLYPSSFYDKSGNLYSTVAAFKELETVSYRVPNYKGNKKVYPRRWVERSRVTAGLAIYIDPRISTVQTPQIYVRVYGLNSKYSTTNSRAASCNYDTLCSCGSDFVWEFSSSTKPPMAALAYTLLAYCQRRYPTKSSWSIPKDQKAWAKSFSAGAFEAISGVLYHTAEKFAEATTGTYYRKYIVTNADVPSANVPLEAGFMFDEVKTLLYGYDPMLLRGQKNNYSYWRNYLTQHACLSACESFPKLNDNSITNAIEVLGFIKSLVVDRKIEIPRSLSQAWLSYRYSYSTTKMDVEEAIKFVKRYSDLGGLERPISCHGSASHTFDNGVTVNCRCSMLVVPCIVSTASYLIRKLDDMGLKPDFYVIWDSIPFSFMADWFLPIGDMLNIEDINSKFFSGEYYKIKNICYSLSYTREFGNVNAKYYSRWRGVVPKALNSFYWLEPPSSSSKTTSFRVLDAASIFIGR